MWRACERRLPPVRNGGLSGARGWALGWGDGAEMAGGDGRAVGRGSRRMAAASASARAWLERNRTGAGCLAACFRARGAERQADTLRIRCCNYHGETNVSRETFHG